MLSISNNIIIAPFAALVPDLVPAEQRGMRATACWPCISNCSMGSAGSASGWLGGLSMLGYSAGGVLTYHIDEIGVFGAYLIIIVVHGLAMVCS